MSSTLFRPAEVTVPPRETKQNSWRGAIVPKFASPLDATRSYARARAFDGSRAHTRLLVASLRKARSVFDVVAAGSDATFPAAVAREFLGVERTEKAAAAFEADVACDVEDEAACIQEAPKNKMIDVAKILGKKKEAA